MSDKATGCFFIHFFLAFTHACSLKKCFSRKKSIISLSTALPINKYKKTGQVQPKKKTGSKGTVRAPLVHKMARELDVSRIMRQTVAKNVSEPLL
jgi:hypothetical protein